MIYSKFFSRISIYKLYYFTPYFSVFTVFKIFHNSWLLLLSLAMPIFGQIVIGPPGVGKTTYCNGIQQFMEAIGRRCEVSIHDG